MNKLDKIIQYHLDNNLATVSGRFKKELTINELNQLRSAIQLNQKLRKLRVSESFGKNSLKNNLNHLDATATKSKSGFRFAPFKFATLGVSVFALLLLIGGAGLYSSRNNNSGNSTNKLSSITTDGSVSSINNVNVAGIEAEQTQLQTESNNLSNVKVDLASTSSVGEVINENF